MKLAEVAQKLGCRLEGSPEIEIHGEPSKRHPNFCATSASFMEEAPQFVVWPLQGCPASLAQAKEGSTAAGQADYSLNRLASAVPAAAATGVPLATPTTSRPGIAWRTAT